MEHIFEEYKDDHFEITRGFSCKNILFYTGVIYKNENGKPYVIYEKVDYEPGFYRRINAKGAYSYKTFDTFHECMLHEGESLI